MSRFLFTYSGNVQGVGFRWKVMDISKSFNVTGYVQNLNSGEVEMLLEGKKNDVIRMAKEIERSLKVFFTSVKKEEKLGEPHFDSFFIKPY